MCHSDLVNTLNNQGLPVLDKILDFLSPGCLHNLWTAVPCLRATLSSHPVFRMKGMVSVSFQRINRKDWIFYHLVYPICLWLSNHCSSRELQSLVDCVQTFGRSGSGRDLRWRYTWEYSIVDEWLNGRNDVPIQLNKFIHLNLESHGTPIGQNFGFYQTHHYFVEIS